MKRRRTTIYTKDSFVTDAADAKSAEHAPLHRTDGEAVKRKNKRKREAPLTRETRVTIKEATPPQPLQGVKRRRSKPQLLKRGDQSVEPATKRRRMATEAKPRCKTPTTAKKGKSKAQKKVVARANKAKEEEEEEEEEALDEIVRRLNCNRKLDSLTLNQLKEFVKTHSISLLPGQPKSRKWPYVDAIQAFLETEEESTKDKGKEKKEGKDEEPWDDWMEIFLVGTELEGYNDIYDFPWNFDHLRDALLKDGKLGKMADRYIYIFGCTECTLSLSQLVLYLTNTLYCSQRAGYGSSGTLQNYNHQPTSVVCRDMCEETSEQGGLGVGTGRREDRSHGPVAHEMDSVHAYTFS